jgi:hypothetical protein
MGVIAMTLSRTWAARHEADPASESCQSLTALETNDCDVVKPTKTSQLDSREMKRHCLVADKSRGAPCYSGHKNRCVRTSTSSLDSLLLLDLISGEEPCCSCTASSLALVC